MNLLSSVVNSLTSAGRHLLRTPPVIKRDFSSEFIDLTKPYLVSKKTGMPFTGKPGNHVFKYLCKMKAMNRLEMVDYDRLIRWYQRHCGKGYTYERARHSVMAMHGKVVTMPYDNKGRWSTRRKQ